MTTYETTSPDSSEQGAIPPAPSPAPLQGQALDRFFQQWISVLCGLDGALVRPSWQSEAPIIPSQATAWASFKVSVTQSDVYPAFVHNSAGEGSDTLQRHETLEVNVTFYDLGVDGQADNLAAILRDGTAVFQNCEILTQNNFGFVEAGDLVSVPVVMKARWQYRVDIKLVVRRIVERTYPVLNLESADGTLNTDQGYKEPIDVTQ